MTVAELIVCLQKFQPDLRVVVEGYEFGYSDVFVDSLSRTRISLNVNTEWWAGRHGDADESPVVEAVCIQRTGADTNAQRLAALVEA